LVALARSALPHQTNRIETAPPDPDEEPPHAAARAPVIVRAAARISGVLQTARQPRPMRFISAPPVSELFQPRPLKPLTQHRAKRFGRLATEPRKGILWIFDGHSMTWQLHELQY